MSEISPQEKKHGGLFKTKKVRCSIDFNSIINQTTTEKELPSKFSLNL